MPFNNPDKLSTFSSYDDIRTSTNFFSDLLFSHSKSSQTQDKQEKTDKLSSKQFFNYKKKRIFAIWTVVFICIIFLVIKFFLNLNFALFFKDLKQASLHPYFSAVVILGFLFFMVNDVFLRIKVLRIKTGRMLKNIRYSEWIRYGFISFLIQSITPFSIGSEPYTIWWLKKKGMDLKSATAVVAVSSFCWFIGQFFITWPSFIYITVVNWEVISNFTITKTYWGIVFGLIIDIFIGSAIFGISYAKKVHYKIALFINSLKRYLGIPHLAQEEIKVKYLDSDSFQKIYLAHLKCKSTYKIIWLFMFQNCYYYLLFAFIYALFSRNNGQTIDYGSFLNVYNIINVSTTANNFLPLPSSEGSIQLVIQSLMTQLTSTVKEASASSNNTNSVSNVIFLWRFFTKYSGLLISFLYLIGFGFNSKRRNSKRCYQCSEIHYELVF